MNVQAVLTRIAYATAVCVVVVMVASITVIVNAVIVVVRVVMMVTMVVMAGLIIRMRVHKRSRKGTNGGCKSHAQRRRERRSHRHRAQPDDQDRETPAQRREGGHCASTCSRARTAGLWPVKS